MQALSIIVAGIAGGLGSSAPLGPINLWLIQRVSERRLHGVTSFLSGVILTDVAFAALAMWGYGAFIRDTPLATYWTLAGGAFLIFFGAAILYHERRPESLKPSGSQRGDFLTGVMLCGSNPAFLMFWTYVVNLLDQQSIWERGMVASTLFVTGVAIGDGLWFFFLIYLTKKGMLLLNDQKMATFRYVIAAAFLVCGSLAFVRHFA